MAHKKPGETPERTPADYEEKQRKKLLEESKKANIQFEKNILAQENKTANTKLRGKDKPNPQEIRDLIQTKGVVTNKNTYTPQNMANDYNNIYKQIVGDSIIERKKGFYDKVWEKLPNRGPILHKYCVTIGRRGRAYLNKATLRFILDGGHIGTQIFRKKNRVMIRFVDNFDDYDTLPLQFTGSNAHFSITGILDDNEMLKIMLGNRFEMKQLIEPELGKVFEILLDKPKEKARTQKRVRYIFVDTKEKEVFNKKTKRRAKK